MKKILLLFLPVLFLGQNQNQSPDLMSLAMKNIQDKDFENAIINLDKSLKINPKNLAALYFKGYLQIIIGEKENGCKSLTDAIYLNSNSAKELFPNKCLDYNPKLNAEKFKNGKFTLQILGYSSLYNFERKDNMQYETFEGKTYNGKITWYDYGDYTVVPTGDSVELLKDNPEFLVRILKIEDETYLYEKIENEQIQFGIVKKLTKNIKIK
ncbi:MAG: hypothetical protein K0R77_2581 [Chryseobacterium sp.]|jgi:tetratricopeptide (TPR) repeat protein|uniref:hypothetical protein n=1 Tax=Chryseobacterium sp. TaxID=1871047 RepID=UPI00261198AE|nr:hypothetical protein [Chryseobacterium sp.]MDF2553306.1 hypothetical protein [Chryseobacterium sp.]